MYKFKRTDLPTISISGIIIFVHFLLGKFGFPIVSINSYWQLPSEACFLETPLKSFLFTHGSSPFLGILHYISYKLGNGDPYAIYSFLLPILHILSFLFFKRAIAQFRLRFEIFILAVLFLNPLIFIYFRYPFYSSYLFFLTCFLLYALFAPISITRKFLFVSLAISIGSFIRPSWHLGLALFWIFYMIWIWRNKLSKRIIALGVVFLLLPVSLYAKNYILFDSFTGSTWLGMNIARFHTRNFVPGSLSLVRPFSKISEYKGLYDEENPLIHKYSNEPCLNGEDFQNIRYIFISRAYYKQVAPKISIRHSLAVLDFGVEKYLKSPGNYFLLKSFTEKISGPWKIYPFTDLLSYSLSPDEEVNVYQFIYPFMIIVFLISIPTLSKKIKLIFLHLLALSFLYCFVDPNESHRMRMEVEPIFYFCVLLSPFYVMRIWRQIETKFVSRFATSKKIR